MRQVLQQETWLGGKVKSFALHGHIARLPVCTLEKGNRQAGQFNGSGIGMAQVHHAIVGEPAVKGATDWAQERAEQSKRHDAHLGGPDNPNHAARQ